MWERLTPGDIARGHQALGVRRDEMLARHAAELEALNEEEGEVDALVGAIEIFMKKHLSATITLNQDRSQMWSVGAHRH